MLSRVADSLYWMSRYIERAENVARLLDINLQLLLDFEAMDDAKLKEHWEPIVRAAGEEELFRELYAQADSESVINFLVFDRKNPSSIVSCIFAARTNASMIRDQISTGMWECLNDSYLFLRSEHARTLWEESPYDFCTKIQGVSHLFRGIADATFPHKEGYDFMQVGKYLERADKTSRMIDIKYHILLPSVTEIGGAIDAVQWAAILRSCSAFEAYHSLYVSSVEPFKVSDFLIFNKNFPRSIRFCITGLNQYLHRISGGPIGHYSNEVERLSGRLLSDLNYGRIDEVFKEGLHEYLCELQRRFVEIGEAMFNNYMFHPRLDMAAEIATQQQQ